MLTLAVVLVCAGCASDFVRVAPEPPKQYERLGIAEGQGCGALLFLATAYNFIPAGLNGRIAAAYDAALKSVPGATGLVDVAMEEEWTWILVGTLRCTTIRGQAIK